MSFLWFFLIKKVTKIKIDVFLVFLNAADKGREKCHSDDFQRYRESVSNFRHMEQYSKEIQGISEDQKQKEHDKM